MDKAEDLLLTITQEIVEQAMLRIAAQVFSLNKKITKQTIEFLLQRVTDITDEEIIVMFVSEATEKICKDVLKTRGLLRMMDLKDVNLLGKEDILRIYQAILKVTPEIIRAGVTEMLNQLHSEYAQADKEAKEKEDVKNDKKRRNH